MSIKHEIVVLAVLVVLSLGVAHVLENSTLDLAALQQIFRIS